MAIIFYKLRNEEEIKVLSPLFFNIKKNKFFKTKYETASLKFHLLKEGEAIYQINKDLEILGFIGYDFSKFDTTFVNSMVNTTIYFENCNMPKHLKIKKGMTVIKNPSFNKKNSIIEFNSLHEGLLKFFGNKTNVEIITDDIKSKLTIVGSLENGLINGKNYQVPTIESLNLIETNIKLGSIKSNRTKIENSDIELYHPSRTSLGKKVRIIDSKLKSTYNPLDLTTDLIDEVEFYFDNVILESTSKIKLPRGYYNSNRYPTRTLYKNQNNKAIYNDLDINRDYIIKLKELKSKYISQEDSKVYVKRK